MKGHRLLFNEPILHRVLKWFVFETNDSLGTTFPNLFKGIYVKAVVAHACTAVSPPDRSGRTRLSTIPVEVWPQAAYQDWRQKGWNRVRSQRLQRGLHAIL